MAKNRFGDSPVQTGKSRFGDSPVQEDVEETSIVGQFGRNLVGVGEGALNFGSGALAGIAHGLRSLGEYYGTDAERLGTHPLTMSQAMDRAQTSADVLTYEPRYPEGKDAANMFSDAYHYGRDLAGKGLEKFADVTSQIPGPLGVPGRVAQTLPGSARTVGEVGFDLGSGPIIGKGVSVARPIVNKLRPEPRVEPVPLDERVAPTVQPWTKDDPQVWRRSPRHQQQIYNKEQKATPYERTEIETPRQPDAAYDYQDYVQVTREEFPSLQKDVVPESRRTTEVDTLQPDGERYRSPRTQEETIPFTKEVPPKIDIETGKKVRRTAKDWQSWRERGPLALGEEAPKVDPFGVDYFTDVLNDLNLPTDKLNRNQTVKSMGGRIKEQKAFLDDLAQEYSSAYQSALKTRTGNLTQSKAAKKALADIEAKFRRQEEILGHMEEALKNKIEEVYGHKGLFDNAGRNEKPLTRQLHPFGKDQSGQINPEVFREGFHKVKKIISKGISLIARGGPEGLRIEVMNDKGVRLGGAIFDKKTMLPENFTGKGDLSEHQSLFSRGTGITQSEQGKGYATEIYKFASELGNDIVPSFSRSPEGRKMWEGFEKKGLSNKGAINRQRGAVDPTEIGAGLAKLFNKKPVKRDVPPETPKPKGPVTAEKRYMLSDNRTPEQFLKDELQNIKEFGDISPLYTEFLPGSNIGTLAKQMPAIKWLGDRALTHDTEARVAKENSKWGATFAPKRGLTSSKFNRRIRSNDGAMTQFEKLSTKDAEQAFRVWLDKYDGIDRPMDAQTLAADGLSKGQANAILAARKQFDLFVDKYNKEAEAAGFDPITVRPNYFPHLWTGDYRIFVKDKVTGETKWVEGMDNKFFAGQMKNKLQERFPEYKVEMRPAGSRYTLDNTDAFREALSLISKDDPIHKVLQKAFEDIHGGRGFKRQTLHNEGKPGYLGTKTGKDGVKDALLAMEMYFDRGHNFIANQRKRSDLKKIVKGMREGGLDLAVDRPRAFNYMNAFIDNSTGAVKDGLSFIDGYIEAAGDYTGIGKSAASNLLSGVNGTASALWLTTPRFGIAQAFQPLYNLPKAVEMKVAGITDKAVSKMFIESYIETFLAPSPDSIAGMNWAREHGYIDSKVMDLMGMKFDNKAKTVGKAFNTLSKWGLGKWEQEMVRTPSFIFYNKLLKDAIPDALERYKTAGMLTDKYMVDYTATDAPLVYGQMGMIGDAIKPLKQFQHAYFGQMLEYLSDIKSEKSAKPIASFLAVQAFSSGLKGLMLAGEVSAIIMAINSKFGTNWETWEEMLATSDLNNTIVFGGASTVTGMDMSGTLGAPQIQQLPTMPGVEFAYKGTSDALALGIAKLKGEDTEGQEMRALMNVTPNALHGVVEEAYTEEGEGTPIPELNMLPMTDPRDMGDKFARYMGGRSLDESRQMMQNRNYKQREALLKKQKDKLLDAIVDHAVNDKPMDDLLNKYVEEKYGDPKSIPKAIVKHLQDKAKNYAEREMLKGSGLTKAQRLQRMQEFNMIVDDMDDPDQLHSLLEEMQNAE